MNCCKFGCMMYYLVHGGNGSEGSHSRVDDKVGHSWTYVVKVDYVNDGSYYIAKGYLQGV